MPRRFGSYELLARLASGGAAHIFLARQPGVADFRKLVCLKMLLPERATDPDFVAMFLDEARLATQLSHPNCVQIYDLGEEQGRYYISMEFIFGETLWELLTTVPRQRRPLPSEAVATIIASAADGLHHAHELSDVDGSPFYMVHRDVSPQNVMVSFEGQTKVLDFGIAKAATGRAPTVVGVVKGKFSYMSPEQISGASLDRRSDVFSLGILLFECLSARRLFRAPSPEEVAKLILDHEPPRLREVVPSIPLALDEICARALSRRPEDRYANTAEMGDALRSFLSDRAVDSPTSIVASLMQERFATQLPARRRAYVAALGGQLDLEALCRAFGAAPVQDTDFEAGCAPDPASEPPPVQRAVASPSVSMLTRPPGPASDPALEVRVTPVEAPVEPPTQLTADPAAAPQPPASPRPSLRITPLPASTAEPTEQAVDPAELTRLDEGPLETIEQEEAATRLLLTPPEFELGLGDEAPEPRVSDPGAPPGGARQAPTSAGLGEGARPDPQAFGGQPGEGTQADGGLPALSVSTTTDPSGDLPSISEESAEQTADEAQSPPGLQPAPDPTPAQPAPPDPAPDPAPGPPTPPDRDHALREPTRPRPGSKTGRPPSRTTPEAATPAAPQARAWTEPPHPSEDPPGGQQAAADAASGELQAPAAHPADAASGEPHAPAKAALREPTRPPSTTHPAGAPPREPLPTDRPAEAAPREPTRPPSTTHPAGDGDHDRGTLLGPSPAEPTPSPGAAQESTELGPAPADPAPTTPPVPTNARQPLAPSASPAEAETRLAPEPAEAETRLAPEPSESETHLAPEPSDAPARPERETSASALGHHGSDDRPVEPSTAFTPLPTPLAPSIARRSRTEPVHPSEYMAPRAPPPLRPRAPASERGAPSSAPPWSEHRAGPSPHRPGDGSSLPLPRPPAPEGFSLGVVLGVGALSLAIGLVLGLLL